MNREQERHADRGAYRIITWKNPPTSLADQRVTFEDLVEAVAELLEYADSRTADAPGITARGILFAAEQQRKAWAR